MTEDELFKRLEEWAITEGHNKIWRVCRRFTMKRTYAGELPATRVKITPGRKRKLYEAQEGRCNICREPFPSHKLEVDEFIPASRGGARVPGNIQLLCKKCNTEKTDHTPSDEAKRTGVGIAEQIARLPSLDDDF